MDYVIGLGKGLVIGVPYGAALVRSGITNSSTVREEFKGTDRSHTLAKTYVSAISVGGATIAVCQRLGWCKVAVAPFNSYAATLGGALMGTGLYMTGCTHSTTWAQLGTGSAKSAAFVLLGNLVGTAAFGYFKESFQGIMKATGDRLSLGSICGLSHETTTLLAIVACIGAVHALDKMSYVRRRDSVHVQTPEKERVIPGMGESVEFRPPFHSINIDDKEFKPYLSGAVIGLTQGLSILVSGGTLGVTSSFMALSSLLLSPLGLCPKPFENSFSGAASLHQVFQNVGIATGAFLMHRTMYPDAQDSVLSKEDVKGKDVFTSFAGGFLLTFGARLGGGCMTGHGLSGVSKWSLMSISTMAATGVGAVHAAVVAERLFN